MKSRVFAAFEAYQKSDARYIRGGAGVKNPTKVVKLPLAFLEDLDILIEEWQAKSESSPESNPRWQKFREFFEELQAILPAVDNHEID